MRINTAMYFTFILLSMISLTCNALLVPERLRCEYLTDSKGIDAEKPRLSWELRSLNDRVYGLRQVAYQLLVASSPVLLEKDQGDMWDSGKVFSDETIGVEYDGIPLKSRDRCWWKVKVWYVSGMVDAGQGSRRGRGGDKEEGVSAWSETAFWSMGLLNPEDWQAKWICAPLKETETPHFGFRSSRAGNRNEKKWVQIDLGTAREIDEIALWGAWPVRNNSPRGDGFPARFVIQAARNADFSDAIVLVDYTERDISFPGTDPVFISFPPTTARFLKLTATRLTGVWKVHGDIRDYWDTTTETWLPVPVDQEGPQADWHLALAEMEVFSRGINVALNASVVASDVFEDNPPWRSNDFEFEAWQPHHLTNGRKEGTPGTLNAPQPVTMMRRTFETGKQIKSATLYATALGNYEVRINGNKAGDHKLAPGWVNYDKRIIYQTHDVTSLLKSGNNTIAVLLADGWYRMQRGLGNFGSGRRAVPERPSIFLGQLEIGYHDGTRQIIVSDGSWQCFTDGPLQYANMYEGVVYDARKEIPGWDLPGQINGWKPVIEHPAPDILISAQIHEPVRVLNAFTPVSVTEPVPGRIIYDFGTSMAGFCRVRINGAVGASVRLRYAEALKPDGTLYLANLLGLSENGDHYILNGKGPLEYEPDFTYHGFRYVELTGDLSDIVMEEILALDVSSDVRQAGFFNSSDSRLDKLCAIVKRGYRSNMPSTIVDVAGRDERLAWMGDCFTDETQSMSYLFDSGTFMANKLRCVLDSQNPEGYPHPESVMTIPSNRGEPGWSDGGISAAWALWLNFGDRRSLETGYEGAVKFMEAVIRQSADGLPGANYRTNFGDWLSARQTIRPGALSWDQPGGKGAPNDLFAATMWGQSIGWTAKMAAALGKTSEARRYEALSESIREAIIRKFVREDGTVEGGDSVVYARYVPVMPPVPAGGDEQSCYALTLGMNYISGALETKSRQRLLEAIQKHDHHFATGSFTTIYLLRYLADNGLQDLAYQMVMQPGCPSYGFMVDNGATAMWERFDAYHPELGFKPQTMNGFNHVGMNSVYEWIFATLAGIRPDPEQPAYKHFFIQPVPPKGLDWVKARYESVRGPIGVEWKVDGNRLTMRVSVPPNTSATLKIPGSGNITVNGNPHQDDELKLQPGRWNILRGD